MHQKTLSICFAFLSFLAYGAVAAPVRSSQLTERDYTTVQHAVNGISHHVGSGTVGSVHALKDTYNGHHAVIKIIKPGAGGGHKAPLPHVEAHNAHHVGQLLGYGHDAATDTHYLVMKHMGVKAEDSGHDQATRDRLNNEANARYAAQHGVRNKDQNGGNFVYHTTPDGQHHAEVVDWAKAEYLDPANHPKVAAPPVQQVTTPNARTCPSCVIQ